MDIKVYIKAEWKGMLKALILSLLVGVLYFSYIKFVGEPITTARNYYNEGIVSMEAEQYQKAYDLFKASKELWYTNEADKSLVTAEIYLR